MKKLALGALVAAVVFAATTVSTDHYDNSRRSWNSSETLLTPSNVTGGWFSKQGAYAVDSAVWASPLILPANVINGQARDLAIIATMNCTLYAFDANLPGSSAIWSTSLCTPWSGYNDHDNFLYGATLGCLASPAADTAGGYIYAACVTAGPTVTLYKVAITTGVIASSVAISGTYGGQTFSVSEELPRTGLTLANGNVYVGFGGYDDVAPWFGWVIGYSAADLSQVGAWCSTPSGTENGGGVWQASGGPAVDAQGNLYFATGNGNYDGVNNFANSIVKLNSTLQLVDWFTPSNYAMLDSDDLDMSSGRVMLIPGTTLLALGEKDYDVYVIDSTCMGHLQGSASGCTAPVIFPTNASGVTAAWSGIYGGLFMNGVGYWPNTSGSIYAFTFSGGAFNQTPLAVSSTTYAFPGAQLSGSSNGASNSIVWAATFGSSGYSSPQPGTLRAFNASTLAQLWNSDANLGDSVGNMPKFVAPVVANGRVYLPNLNNQVLVYGVGGSGQMTGLAALSGAASMH